MFFRVLQDTFRNLKASLERRVVLIPYHVVTIILRVVYLYGWVAMIQLGRAVGPMWHDGLVLPLGQHDLVGGLLVRGHCLL